VYRKAGWMDEARKAYSEALAIYRDLVARDPGAYRPNVAITLQNLGLLYIDMQRQAEARSGVMQRSGSEWADRWRQRRRWTARLGGQGDG
jgi:hypothetical protein